MSESVCALVFRRRSGRVEFLLLHRIPARGGFWQSVSGRIESGERAEPAVRREVMEETGFDPLRVIHLEKVNVFYNVALEAIHFEPCLGVEVAGGEPVLSAEHDAYCWSEGDEAERLIPYTGVREALRELREVLARVERS